MSRYFNSIKFFIIYPVGWILNLRFYRLYITKETHVTPRAEPKGITEMIIACRN